MNPQTESKSILDNPKVQERAIIYCRVSSDEQSAFGTSISNQVEKGLAYAAAHSMQVIATFEEDYTGTTLDRPELNRVRELLRTGQADTLIVYNSSRLDRSKYGVNTLVLMVELHQLGVGLHFSELGRQIDLNNHMDVFMYGSLGGWQAGKDRDDTVKKLHDGRLSRAKSGFVVPNGPGAPFGYRKVKIDKRWHFEIVEEEAAVVRQIFGWYVYGDESGQTLSLQKIAAKLNQMGISKRQNPKWTVQMVHHLIACETYAGVWLYGKRSKDNRQHTAGAIRVAITPIIKSEVWKAAQERLQQNKEQSQRNRKPGRYLFSSRVTCGECHYKMMGQAKYDKYFYYRCPCSMGKGLRKMECHLPSFRADLVDQRAWDKLEAASRDEKQLIEGLQGYQARQESKLEPIKRELAYVEQLLNEKSEEWESAYLDQKLLTSERAKARKAIEIDQLEQVIKELEKRQAELLSQLEEKSLTNEQIIGLATFALQIANAMALLREAESRGVDMPELRAAVFEEKRRLLAMLDVQVELFVLAGKKKGRLTAKYCPDGQVFSVSSVDICSSEPANDLTSQKT